MWTIVVSGSTTIYDIQHELTLRRLYPATQCLPYISMNGCRNRLLQSSDTMNEPSAGPLSHFTFRCLFLGGSGLCLLVLSTHPLVACTFVYNPSANVDRPLCTVPMIFLQHYCHWLSNLLLMVTEVIVIHCKWLLKALRMILNDCKWLFIVLWVVVNDC